MTKTKRKVVIVSGGFDPIHSGHIRYINAAKALGDFLVCGPNSDSWLKRKKGYSFQDIHERKIILENIRAIDRVVEFDDGDDTAIDLIRRVISSATSSDVYIFANGGDRTNKNIPEMILSEEFDSDMLIFEFGVGGTEKINSSSHIIERVRKL